MSTDRGSNDRKEYSKQRIQQQRMKLRVCVGSSWNTKLSEQFEVREVMMGVLETLRTSIFTLFWEAMGGL